jgi:hypothetical protein
VPTILTATRVTIKQTTSSTPESAGGDRDLQRLLDRAGYEAPEHARLAMSPQNKESTPSPDHTTLSKQDQRDLDRSADNVRAHNHLRAAQVDPNDVVRQAEENLAAAKSSGRTPLQGSDRPRSEIPSG